MEDLGNCVKINDTVIPAVNIQVDGFPKWIDDTWYGIYFEIMFEDGTLWEIEQRHTDMPVMLSIYPNWGRIQNFGVLEKDFSYMDAAIVNFNCGTWEWFLVHYHEKRVEMELIRHRFWEDVMNKKGCAA